MVVVTAVVLAGTASIGNAQLLPFQQDQNQNQLDRRTDAREIRANPQAEVRITRAQAANLARQRFPGAILRVVLVGEGANQRYQIRMENEGKVFTVFVNAATGRVTGGA